MAITFFDPSANNFAVIADPRHSFQPPSYTSSTINRDGFGNVTSVVYRNSAAVVYTIAITHPTATQTVMTDGSKTLTITTNETGQATGSVWQ